MILLLPFGLAVGMTMGALGAGGSILAIPVLVHLGGLDVHAATTASLAVVGVGALSGLLPHWHAGRVHLGIGLTFGAVGSGGAVLGTALNRRLSDDVLLVAFAVFALTVAVLLVRRVGLPAAGLGAADGGHGGWWRIAALGTAVGFATGLFGVGGGFVVVPALVLIAGFRMREAIGTSLLVITVNAAVALTARLPSLGIDWSVAGPFAGAGVVGVFLGSLVARHAAPVRLGFALAGLLLVVAGVLGLPAAARLAG